MTSYNIYHQDPYYTTQRTTSKSTKDLDSIPFKAHLVDHQDFLFVWQTNILWLQVLSSPKFRPSHIPIKDFTLENALEVPFENLHTFKKTMRSTTTSACLERGACWGWNVESKETASIDVKLARILAKRSDINVMVLNGTNTSAPDISKYFQTPGPIKLWKCNMCNMCN